VIEPRIVGIMLAKDEADVMPDVIANLEGALDALYYHAGDAETAAVIRAAYRTGWARKVVIPEGVPHTDGLRQYLLEQARRDAVSDNDSRPMWVMVVQGDEIYHDDLRSHVLYAHQIGATMMTCQVATFLLHESQRDGWDWGSPLTKRLTHYIWDFGEHTGFLDKPTIYYDPSVHMRAHPFGTDDGIWSPARPVRKHYPFRTPEQARKRLDDRLRPTEQHPDGWQPHYKNYQHVFVGDVAADRPVKRFNGVFPEVYRHPNFWGSRLERREDFQMRFEIKPPFVIFHDDKPGSHAMLHGPQGVRYPFRNDASCFDDNEKRYAWAFEGSPSPGDRLTFTTSERRVDGVVASDSSVAFVPVIVMRKLPKVSVVTCSYNRPDLLRTAIESMRAQTDPDWEHLIYDDASTDPRVHEVLAEAVRDPRVRVWCDTVNHDQPSTIWNFLLDRSYGRYLTVLDDDNMKLPRFVERMSAELDADPSLDIVTCGWRVDREDEPPVDYLLNLSTNAEQLKLNSTCDGGAMLYRREAFERVGYFSEAFRTSEDWDWLRRALQTSKHKNLQEVHATYRSHNKSRMYRAAPLGRDADMMEIQTRPLTSHLGLSVTFPPHSRLTASQIDVCQSISRAQAVIPWIQPGRDLALVVSPFQMSSEDIANAIGGHARVLSLHMEDPYALSTNLERVKQMAANVETWVCTNDASTLPYYQAIVGGRVIVCPTLGPDDQLAREALPRDIDVLICGYAYPSRKRFVDELLPKLNGLRTVFIGDGWTFDGLVGIVGIDCCPETHGTQPLGETYQLHARAKAVVCMHRVHGDCSDGAVEPTNVNRGAMEGYLGARVFLDRSRPLHDFDDSDVVWYDSPVDLATKLRAYLATNDERQAAAFVAKCRLNYTYRTRLARVINCVRSPRYLAEVP
jgi:hypothetical protein